MKFNNSNGDNNQKLKLWQNAKTQIVTKLKLWGIKLKITKCDKTQIVTKLDNSNDDKNLKTHYCDKTQNLIVSKTQIVKELKLW